MSYHVGDVVTIYGAWTNAGGTATDAGTVYAHYRDPAGTATTYTYGSDAELVKDSTGVYHVDISAALAGTWYYRFYSTGSGQAASLVNSFIVFPSDFP